MKPDEQLKMFVGKPVFLKPLTTSIDYLSFASTDSGFGLLLTSIRHQENLCPNRESTHNRLYNWTTSEASTKIRFRLCRCNPSPFLSTLQLLLKEINFTLPDILYHLSASTRLFSRIC
ncbi:hypothetical protein EcSMS35_3130 [Escherichia coli SMS-3-5]|uniref:Uncharacterized protein n=1 Tax=Escherichia coli (strain SMS-3-5 / SECEC) TaxID=439855 RepID=B1LDJ2_ECOSM|nr:hypothetical protein EcSMS35_3130 [Escherichia coli SMS-3-5]